MFDRVRITDDMLIRAKARSRKLGALNNSFTKGQGNIYGFLGEELFCRYFSITPKDEFNYDFEYKDKKYEIKSKHCSTEPKEHFECSIAETSIFQDTDVYVFTRILNDLSVGWLLGYISKCDFFKDEVYPQ